MDAHDGTDRLPRSAKWAAVLGGALLAAVPTFVAALVDDSAGDTWFVMLGLAGLCALGVGFWFGVTTRQSVGWQVLVRLCAGAAVGMFMSVMIVEPEAPGFALFGVPVFVLLLFWLPGSLGIALGTMAYRFRTSDDQQVKDNIQSGYYEPGGEVSTSSGQKRVLDLEPGDSFTDSAGQVVTATANPEVVSSEVHIAVQSPRGRGLRRWHISQLDRTGDNS